MAEGLDRVVELAEKYNLIASYHPHLGTMVQSPDQLDKLMPLTKINLCPDLAHVEAGGGDSVKVVGAYKDRIKYVHLKDFADGYAGDPKAAAVESYEYLTKRFNLTHL